jgi:hypothetical protein
MKFVWDVETYVFLENLIISGRNRTFHELYLIETYVFSEI